MGWLRRDATSPPPVPAPYLTGPAPSLRAIWDDAGREIIGCLVVLVVLYLGSQLLPTFQLRGIGYVLLYAWLGVFMAAVVVTLASAVPYLRANRVGIGATGVGCLVLAVVSSHLGIPIVSDLLKFGAAWGIGSTFALLAEADWWMPLAAIFAGLADAWSVYSSSGVTNHLVKGHAATLQAATIVIPLPGYTYHQALNGFGIGITDFTFTAVYLSTAVLWALPVLRTAIWLVIGIVGTIALDVQVLSGHAVPVLPLLSACFLIAVGPTLWRRHRGGAPLPPAPV